VPASPLDAAAMSFPGPICYFCGKPPLDEFKVRSATPIKCARLNGRLPETFSILCLCQQHYDVLAAAGRPAGGRDDTPRAEAISNFALMSLWLRALLTIG
jgi:hypothetical protein